MSASIGRNYLKDVDEVFKPDGLLSRHLNDFEYREEQGRMASEVALALETGEKLVVEAGTGTGKTLAYLIPAVISGVQVVVSTGTRNLQEQIYFRDIPLLRSFIGRDFSAVMLKGRSNYLCPIRLKRFSQVPIFKKDVEEKWWTNIYNWSKTTSTGDRAELTDLPEGNSLWPQICSNSDFCSSQKCGRASDCFITKLRSEAEQAELIVVNHHLFFADLAIRGKGVGAVLPPYEAVIFDEAHLVEEIASHYFGISVSNYRLEELIRDTLREIDTLELKNKSEIVRDMDYLDTRMKNFFLSFRQPTERRFSLADVPPDKEATAILLSSLVAMESKIGSINPLPEAARALARRFHILHDELSKILAMDDAKYIFWGEARGGGIFLNASSIDVAPVMKETLYSSTKVIFTSATLSSAGDFSYICSSLGAEEAKTLALPSPFDFQKQVKIYLPKMPPPDSNSFSSALAEESEKLINIVKGRTLFLFTSFRRMYEIRSLIEDKIPYTILIQGEAPRHTLLERFKENIDSVLLATSSFWQGVDVPGESLSCVIIDRLPFASPGDPIMSARIDHIKKNGGNPFKDYQLPDAVLTLKQGLGRLIRHRNDRGIMMIADSRIKTKGYGKTFLASLPPAPVVDSIQKLDWS